VSLGERMRCVFVGGDGFVRDSCNMALGWVVSRQFVFIDGCGQNLTKPDELRFHFFDVYGSMAQIP
jgi:hypothetical protein